MKYRIRIAATDPHTGLATRWRIISGNGARQQQHGEFASLAEAVEWVTQAKEQSK